MNGEKLTVKTTEGSTIVHIAKEDLAKLEVGRYNLEITFEEGKTTKAGTINVALVVEKPNSTSPSNRKDQDSGQKPSNNKQGKDQKSSSKSQKASPKTSDISIFLPAFITLASAGAYVFADKRKK